MTEKKLVTKSDLLLSIILVLGAAVAWALYDTISLNEKERRNPIQGIVKWENTLCGETVCSQELTVETDKGNIRVMQRTKNFYAVGDAVQLVKVHRKKVLPGRMGSGNTNVHYEIYVPDS